MGENLRQLDVPWCHKRIWCFICKIHTINHFVGSEVNWPVNKREEGEILNHGHSRKMSHWRNIFNTNVQVYRNRKFGGQQKHILALVGFSLGPYLAMLLSIFVFKMRVPMQLPPSHIHPANGRGQGEELTSIYFPYADHECYGRLLLSTIALHR